jgi:signal transduction histidine kinase
MATRLSRLVDVALAAGLAAAGLGEIWTPFASRQGEGSAVVSTLVVLVVAAALVWRRRAPLASGAVVLLTWMVVFSVTPVYVLFLGQFVPMAVAVFSLARYGAGRVPYVGAALGAVALLYVDLFVAVLQSPGEIVFHWGVFALAWGFGFGLRRLERRAEESTRRAVELEVAAAEQAMAAVLAERTRIARELHDIVAHTVSTMVVQAGAAEQVVGEDDAFVRRALATIRTTGADALGDMRRVVAMLRDADETGSLAPQPGVDGVPALVAAARQAGLDATLETEGELAGLPPGVDLAVYRIVQESLTNVRRHAGATRVTVRLVRGADGLEVEVADDGSGPGSAPEGGHGLVGMRERAALYGGSLATYAVPGGGFGVRVHLPVASGSGGAGAARGSVVAPDGGVPVDAVRTGHAGAGT